MALKTAGYASSKVETWDVNTTQYQKRVFDSFSGGDSYNIYFGDDVWSPEWRQHIRQWYSSRSMQGQGLNKVVKFSKNKIVNNRRNPKDLEFADLFLVYPVQAYALRNLMEKFVQLDFIITKNDMEVPQKPLGYLENLRDRYSAMEKSSTVPVFKVARQGELVQQALDSWNWTRPSKVESTDITWIFDEVKSAERAIFNSVKELLSEYLVKDDSIGTEPLRE